MANEEVHRAHNPVSFVMQYKEGTTPATLKGRHLWVAAACCPAGATPSHAGMCACVFFACIYAYSCVCTTGGPQGGASCLTDGAWAKMPT
eukprot:1161131-Pelagomonas_calceolata.AAC.14